MDAALLPIAFQVLSKSQRVETIRIHQSHMLDDIMFSFLQSLIQLHCLEFHGTPLAFNLEAVRAYVSSSLTPHLRYLTLCNLRSYQPTLEDDYDYKDCQEMNFSQVLPLLASLPNLCRLNIESTIGTMDGQVVAAFAAAVTVSELSAFGISRQSHSTIHTFSSPYSSRAKLLLHRCPHLRRVIMNNRRSTEPYIKFIDI